MFKRITILLTIIMVCLGIGLVPANAAIQSHRPTPVSHIPFNLSAGLWDNFGHSGALPAHNNGHNNAITIGGAPMVVRLDYNCTTRTINGQTGPVCEIHYVNTDQCFNWYPAGDWVSEGSCVTEDNNELWAFFSAGGCSGCFQIQNVAADLAGANGTTFNYLTAFNDVFQCDGLDSGETLYMTGFIPNCAGNSWQWLT